MSDYHLIPTVTNDLCNEVRDLREQLREWTIAALVVRFSQGDVDVSTPDKYTAAEADARTRLITDSRRMRDLLTAVLDAGRPHSHYCMCDCCNAWLAVRKELRGE